MKFVFSYGSYIKILTQFDIGIFITRITVRIRLGKTNNQIHLLIIK